MAFHLESEHAVLAAITVIGLIVMGAVALFGDGAPTNDEARADAAQPDATPRPLRLGVDAWVHVDPETGCQYLVVDRGVTPRFDRAGRPMCGAGR